MSVAFRRDSDEEHLEPRFELPIPPGPNLVTRRGYALIEERLAALDAELEPIVDAETRKPLLRDRRYWRSRIASAQITPVRSLGKVAFGTRVTILRDNQTQTVDLVGHDESDPANGRIAFTAPLARALMGLEVGDEIALPAAPAAIEITAIALIPERDNR